jgi:hypothetical protein
MPAYDFNWQTNYVLAEPKLLPEGTEMVCTALFDNSEENLHNPDSSKEVRWGDQTWEEMMIGWYDIAFPIEQFEQLVKESQERLKKRQAESSQETRGQRSG